jgi:hypothetical protein
LGAGEIVLNSIDADGTKAGFDLEITRRISESVGVPVVASGGAGSLEHMAEVLLAGKADAVLAASIFHFGEYTVGDVKKYLASRNIPVRRRAFGPGAGGTLAPDQIYDRTWALTLLDKPRPGWKRIPRRGPNRLVASTQAALDRRTRLDCLPGNRRRAGPQRRRRARGVASFPQDGSAEFSAKPSPKRFPRLKKWKANCGSSWRF